jgi:isoquinoline 1-oxidoreductase alpha subunit
MAAPDPALQAAATDLGCDAMTSMTVNGEAIHYRIDPDTPLLFALRDASNLTGAKHGCYSGDCGSCTVIVDGRAVLSCQLTIAAAEGADVTTIEGLSADRAHPLQQAWAAEQVSQCGRCDPGFIMALAALMRATPNPTPEQLSSLPNICRCGATPRILMAIARAAQVAAPLIAPAMPAPASVGDPDDLPGGTGAQPSG